MRRSPVLSASACRRSPSPHSPIGQGGAAQGRGPDKAVIELFTSQGCSSCPPADALLAELGKKPGYVTLSYSVDYWNYLGWRDTLSSAANSNRQREYARMRGDGRSTRRKWWWTASST